MLVGTNLYFKHLFMQHKILFLSEKSKEIVLTSDIHDYRIMFKRIYKSVRFIQICGADYIKFFKLKVQSFTLYLHSLYH